MKKLAVIILALAALCLEARAQTTLTGTFLTASGQTPQAANLKVSEQIAGTSVCGELTFTPYNAATGQPQAIIWNGTSYLPQPVQGYVRCSDGKLLNSSGLLGVSIVPNSDGQPAGTVTWMRGGLDGSSDGKIRPASWSEAKIIPDQSSVDWGSLPEVTIVDVGYQTIEQNGIALNARQTVNYSGAANCTDNPSLNRTDCSLSTSGISLQTLNTPNTSQSVLNFLASPAFHGLTLTPSSNGTGGEQFTLSGTLTPDVLGSEAQNCVLAGPASGGAGNAICRALVAADLPTISYSSLSGLPQLPQNISAVSHEWLASYNATTGLFTQSQPAFTDLSGVASNSQIPWSSPGAIGSGTPSTGAFSALTINGNGGLAYSGAWTMNGCIEATATAGVAQVLGSSCGSSGGGLASVGLSSTAGWFTVGNSPLTVNGTLTLNLTTGEPANEILATPNGVSGVVGLRALVAADIPTLNQATTADAGGLTGCAPSTIGSLCYWSGSGWALFPGNASGTQFLQENASGALSWSTPAGSGNVNGPVSSTVNDVAAFNNTGGTLLLDTAIPYTSLATLSGSQTLTNKTISGATNTLSNIPCSALPALSGDVTSSAGSCATTVAKLLNIALPTLAGQTGFLYDNAGVLQLNAASGAATGLIVDQETTTSLTIPSTDAGGLIYWSPTAAATGTLAQAGSANFTCSGTPSQCYSVAIANHSANAITISTTTSTWDAIQGGVHCTMASCNGNGSYGALLNASGNLVINGGYTAFILVGSTTAPGVWAAEISPNGAGSSSFSLEVNGGAALTSPVNFQTSSGAGQIDISNPSGSIVQAVLHNTSTTVNGQVCALAGACTITAAPSANPLINTDSSLSASAASGLSIPGTSLTVGDLYYESASGLALAEANSSSTVPGICIAISATSCVYEGVYRFSASQSWTVGGVVYVSDSASGGLTQTEPSASGHFVQVVGVALANDTLFVHPSLDIAGIQ